MRPVHEFIGNFDEPDNAEPLPETPALEQATIAAPLQEHERDSSVRNVCFEWLDGRKAFFNYGYLIAAELTINDQDTRLTLTFGSYTVIVKGYRLGVLFERLKEHRPKTIIAVAPRYAIDGQHSVSVVTDIIVKSE
jgi:1,4-dihydroxy-2-naphthoyl-CoA synthase